MSDATPITRLAPSPTGDLHLGNARTFLLNWAIARHLGWRIVLRHEDLDASRVSADACRGIEDSLAWLGLDWDGPARRQSTDLQPYRSAMRTLAAAGTVFRSELSRREIREAVNAPHGGELVFPASLRPDDRDDWRFDESGGGHRFAMRSGTESIRDELAGPHDFDPAREGGDPILWTRDGRPSYQLAVVVDDLTDGVTDVFRGDDLLPSSARQVRLRTALGRPDPPRWWHVPLLFDESGRRLAKRDGDHGLAALRDSGVPADRVVGLLLHLSGVLEHPAEIPATRIPGLIDVATLRTLCEAERSTPCRVTPGHLAWLTD